MNIIEKGYRDSPIDQSAAESWCKRYAQAHTENFNVVSWFLPKKLRGPMYTIYAYCRFTDDLGDEAEGDRLAMLEEWDADLNRAFKNSAQHPINISVGALKDRFPLEAESFLRLNQANKLDQHKKRYLNFAELLDYCTLSANPVGHMVLAVFGYTDSERKLLSDATCTALQLTNHWQDITRDYKIGRLYLPIEDLERFNVTEAQIAEKKADENFRALMQFETNRAETFFSIGSTLPKTVEKSLRIDLELFTDGGRAVLESIKGQNYDVLSHRPKINKMKGTWLLARAISRHWIW